MAQRRGAKIAMNDDELAEFLAAERTCRVATSSHSGPHVTPLWFVWHEGAFWLHSLFRSQRWTDIERSPQIAIIVDTGHDYFELRGVELSGEAEVVGEIPRLGADHPDLPAIEAIFTKKYFGLDEMFYDGKHAWLRVVPAEIRSWDFRKLADLAR